MIVKQITELIGNTPLLEIDPTVHGLKNINLYAKLELLNPFGSVKDKTAWNMLRHNLDEIKLRGQSVIESSSGNTAKAIQMICAAHGIPFKIVTNRVRVREVKQILQLAGTEIDELPGQSQCLDPNDPNDPLFIVEKIMNSQPGKYFHTSQYTNEKNSEAHFEMTGKEIAQDLTTVDYFIGGLGTSGSTLGTAQYLRMSNPALKTIGIVSSKNGFLPGIRNSDEMYEVGLFNRKLYHQVIEVDTDEALDAMLILIRSLGVLSGPTGGASLAGALKYLRQVDRELDRRSNAVFLVCDRVEWYLSYLQKCRPEWFGISKKQNRLKELSDEDLAAAPEMGVDQAESWLSSRPNALIVDLRGSLAFKGSHLSGSVNIPGESLEEMLEWNIPFSHDRPVLFVCPVGLQSKRFAAHFSKLGLSCLSLQGGFVAWRDAGKPLIRMPGSAVANRLTAGSVV